MSPVTMHRSAILLSVLLAGGITSAEAQNSVTLPKVGDSVIQLDKVNPRDGEFRQSAFSDIQGISCTMVVKPGTAPPVSPDYSHCLRMGPLKIGMELYQLQIALINLKTIPEQNIVNPRIADKSPSGVITAVFPITTITSGEGFRMQSYLVAVIDKSGAVQVIQLTGKPSDTSTSFPFSSIFLGTPSEKVVEILGNPSSISDVPQVQGKLWSYAPFPFTVEIVNGVVYSVRIHAPSDSDYQKAFIPLKSLLEQ